MRRAFWWIVGGILLLDQVSKLLVQTLLPLHLPHPVIPGILDFTHVLNDGSAFGQFRGHGRFLIAAAFLAAAAILLYRRMLLQRGEKGDLMLLLGLALPLAGAAGNTIDRIRVGEVIDFIEVGKLGPIDLRWFPVFNVADISITIGAVAMLIHFFFLDRPARAPASTPVETAAIGQEP